MGALPITTDNSCHSAFGELFASRQLLSALSLVHDPSPVPRYAGSGSAARMSAALPQEVSAAAVVVEQVDEETVSGPPGISL